MKAKTIQMVCTKSKVYTKVQKKIKSLDQSICILGINKCNENQLVIKTIATA